MIANINPETGIRYGVVSLGTLAEWVFDEFFYQGTNLTAEAAKAEFLTEFKAERGHRAEPSDDEWQEFWDGYEGYEENYELETEDGLKLGLSYLGGAPLVWVFESPHRAEVRLCSPCVPNAGDLDSPEPNGFECYDLPREWYA